MIATTVNSEFFSEPDIPIVASSGAVESTNDTITLKGSSISTPSSSNFDKFSITAVSDFASFDRNETGSATTSADLQITGLSPATQYNISVVTEVGSGPTTCNYVVDSDVNVVTACTGIK